MSQNTYTFFEKGGGDLSCSSEMESTQDDHQKWRVYVRAAEDGGTHGNPPPQGDFCTLHNALSQL